MPAQTQRYRLTRRYGPWAAGEEVELTEVDAILWDNESPGVLERVEASKAAKRQPAPKVDDDADV